MLSLVLVWILASGFQENALAPPVKKPAKVLSRPEAQPSCAVPRGVAISVTIVLVVNVEGKPEQLQVARSGGVPCLDESALKTAAKYRFAPATENGVKIATQLRLEINFSQS